MREADHPRGAAGDVPVLLACSGHCSTPTSRTGPLAWSESGLRPSPATTRGPDQCCRVSDAFVQDVPAQEALDPNAATLLNPSPIKSAPIASTSGSRA